jgi:hypothetical protein
MTNFASNIDHIAKLDNSFAMSLALTVNNVVLRVGNTYDVSTTVSIYNRTTSITEHKTIIGTLSTTDIDTYLTSIKTQLELAYPVTVSHSTSIGINSVAISNIINVGLIVNTSGYYVRNMEMSISLSGVQQYSIDATLISPIELTPTMLNITPEVLASLNTITTVAVTQVGIVAAQASAASASAASALNSLNTLNAAYTGSDLLTKIKTVDGTGSGLDADLLEGMQPLELPISTATQSALDLKAPLVSPSFITPALGTPSSGNLANCTFPTLNQNTTGTSSSVTGIVSGANGGTGIANTGHTIILGGNLTTSGAFSTTLTSIAETIVTLPTSGTLSTLAGTETLSNKTLVAPSLTGIPTAPTAIAGTNTTQLATTEYVLANSVQATEYATSTIGGIIKMRIDGSTLYITNNGLDA